MTGGGPTSPTANGAPHKVGMPSVASMFSLLGEDEVRLQPPMHCCLLTMWVDGWVCRRAWVGFWVWM